MPPSSARYKSKLIALGLTSALATAGTFVAQHEGLVLGTYVDPVGIMTSCFGHTGQELKPNTKFTEDQCLAQLAKDLDNHNSQMSKSIKVPISEEERAAYLSFTYNIGNSAFANSTLLKKLNNHDHYGACLELTKWVYAKGKLLKGLVTRRQSEKELCLKGVNNE